MGASLRRDKETAASFHRAPASAAVPGCPYYITGTFNDWKYEEMEAAWQNYRCRPWQLAQDKADASVPGLFYASIRITANVEEEHGAQES